MTTNTLKKLCLVALYFAASLMTGGAQAISLSQVPLFVGAGVDPNLMFVLDDSGSMRVGFMPDGLTSNMLIGTSSDCYYDSSTGTYNDGYYGGQFTCFYYVNNGREFLASSHLNKQYYDPNKTYSAPPRGDKTNFPDVSFTNAPFNGYDSSSTTTDLSSRYRAIMDDLNLKGFYDNGNYVSGFAISTNAAADSAFYYTFDGTVSGCDTNPYSDSCYTRVDVTQQSDAEKQNFANWFSYYRTRIMSAKAGIGFAFDAQPEALRVGYGTINTSNTVVRGVRQFSNVSGGSQYRQQFFNWLYGVDPYGDTPLRRSLGDAGDYYSITDSTGPYSSTPGVSGGTDYECRASYTVLMTDGYWNGNNPAVGNEDGTDGTTITNTSGDTYQYKAGNPFTDTYNNTLADVAMHYWKNDLQPGIDNKVATSQKDPAFWQHMVTYGVGLGVKGAVDPANAFAAINDPTISISWPDPAKSDSAKIDDLLHASVNGRGGFYSAGDPQAFSRQLSSVLAEVVDRGKGSSSSIAANSTRLDTDSLIYQGLFNSDGWSGDLLAYSLTTSGDVITKPTWSAATKMDAPTDDEVLQTKTSTTPNGRKMLVADASGGLVNFIWSNLDSQQQAALNLQDGLGADRVKYIRGDRRLELSQGGKFRDRTSRMGDIVHSSPAFSGREGFGYQDLPGQEGVTYNAYRSSKRNRREMVYVGANDGLLHGFDANTGEEVFSFIPSQVLGQLPDLTNPNYGHHFFVDGSPIVTDAYLNGAWKTVLIGTMDAGGKEIFALDVSDPNNPSLLWEFSNDALGEGVSEASVVYVKDSSTATGYKWLVAAGNGYNSVNGTASLLLIDMDTGGLYQNVTVPGAANGMAGITAISTDTPYVADTIYGGDLQGHLWKFNQDSKDVWQVAISKGKTPLPLMTATDSSGNPQPITARPDVSLNADGDLMVFFGTGKYLGTSDVTDLSEQTIYGVIDSGSSLVRGDLQQQTIDEQGSFTSGSTQIPYRVVSNNDRGSASGWYMDLISPVDGDQGERSVVRPVLRGSAVLFTTLIPSDNPCNGGGSGWIMALNLDNGGRIDGGVLDLNGDGVVDDNDLVKNNAGDYVPASGLGSEHIITRPNFLSGPGDVDIGHASDSAGNVQRFNIKGDGSTVGRQSWRQIR
ncbi:MAG: PilC/PilY family type IV pilus protein [Alcanivorax sp.]|nr:PilC/PilY family type IV pilus protein [Alcanivorax sp.]